MRQFYKELKRNNKELINFLLVLVIFQSFNEIFNVYLLPAHFFVYNNTTNNRKTIVIYMDQNERYMEFMYLNFD